MDNGKWKIIKKIKGFIMIYAITILLIGIFTLLTIFMLIKKHA